MRQLLLPGTQIHAANLLGILGLLDFPNELGQLRVGSTAVEDLQSAQKRGEDIGINITSVEVKIQTFL